MRPRRHRSFSAARTPDPTARAGGAAVGAALALAAILLPPPAHAQTISGRTMDGETDEEIDGVEVVLLDTLGERRAVAVSDSAGAFGLGVPGPGTYVIEASRLGYDTLRTRRLDVSYGEAIEVVLRLGVRALALDPLTVTARRRDPDLRARDLREYYERVERYADDPSVGILTREDLEQFAGIDVGRLLGRWIVPRARCAPTVYLDGQLVKRMMITQLRVTNIEGVEFYPQTDAPGRFLPDDTCGVLLVWSRPLEDNANPLSLPRFLAALGAAVGLWLLTR